MRMMKGCDTVGGDPREVLYIARNKGSMRMSQCDRKKKGKGTALACSGQRASSLCTEIPVRGMLHRGRGLDGEGTGRGGEGRALRGERRAADRLGRGAAVEPALQKSVKERKALTAGTACWGGLEV